MMLTNILIEIKEKFWHTENLVAIVAIYLIASGKVPDVESALGIAGVAVSLVAGRSYHKGKTALADGEVEKALVYLQERLQLEAGLKMERDAPLDVASHQEPYRASQGIPTPLDEEIMKQHSEGCEYCRGY